MLVFARSRQCGRELAAWEVPVSDAEIPLAELLRLAEWGPRQLVTAINSRLSGQGRDRLRLDPTAGYSWVRRGFRPRPPIPDIAAAVLSERLGYTVTAAQLWPGRQGAGGPPQDAASGLDGVAGLDAMIRELSNLGATAATPQSPITGASGADLTVAVVDYFNSAVVAVRDRAGHDHVLTEQVELISSHVAALRRLDDRHGGGALSLRYVTAELRSVADLVEYASYGPEVGGALLTIMADLAQLLGWLSFDSSRYGAAERYLLLSLGISRALGASDRAANAIGMLSYVSAFAGHGPDAVRLAEAAGHEAGKSGDPILRARLLGREATAAAADGDLARFRRQSQEAASLLARYAARDAPSFLYYLAPEQLAAEAGQGLVVLAERTTAGRQRLLREAVGELTAAVSTLAGPGSAGSAPAYPRSALLHATFLARACILLGDLEQAMAAMRTGLGLLAQVQSPRGRAYLNGLRPVMARRSRSPQVRDFLAEFDEASSRL
jgi:hypothetical protein